MTYLNIQDCKTEDDFLLEMISTAVWNVLYHEKELGASHRKLAVTKTALARGYTAADLADVVGNADLEDEDEPETPVEFARSLLKDALSSIMYHEDRLHEAHQGLAFVKGILARASFKFDPAKIEAEQAEKLARPLEPGHAASETQ